MNAVTFTIEVYPDNRDEFIQSIRSMNESFKKEKGFKRFALFQDVDNPYRFNLIDEWDSREDLVNHMRSENFKILRGALKALSKQSERRYYLMSDQIS